MGSGSAPLSFATFSCTYVNWDRLDRSDRLLEQCSIALVGKYTKFSDSYASVIKALEHSALAISHKLEVKVRARYKDSFAVAGVGRQPDGKQPSVNVSPPQYIDSACLEPSTLQEEPVKYHEAWQKLCSSE